jgi:hypothetical protein
MTTVLAPNVAQFNQVNSFLIHSDLVKNGVQLNQGYSQILGRVLIDKAPGSQLLSTPFSPPRIAADDLAGQQKSRIRLWLTDDQDRLVDTNSEKWTCRILITYQAPHASSLEH